MTADPSQGALFTHRNHYLFADYYLDRRAGQQPEWREADAGPALATVTALWRKYKLQSDNEAQTEEDWIRPVLRALGHHFNVQVGVQTPLGAKITDYAFYPNDGARQAAKRGVLTEADFAGALAVGDAKAWERSLDRAAVKEVKTLHENPSLQIDTYIRHSGLPWGILTNGRLWRLYHKDTSKKLDVYYEVDLPALIEQGNAEAFKYFWLFFRREAFVAGAHAAGAPAWLDLVLAESRAYEQGVSENLKAQVYDALRHLAQGFLDFPGNDLQPTVETLKQIHDNSLIVLYRLLFMFYAEARDLLPVRENRLYAEGYSLEALKARIASDLDDGRPAAASMSGLWQQLYEQWHVIDTGDASLGVPAYNGGLFRPDKHPFIERYRVGDLHLRQAVDLLARAVDPATGRREFVDYRDLEIRHLGSIYEGLLEYHLRYADAPLVIVRQKGKELYEPAKGAAADVSAGQVYLATDKGERKATGSYYTPDYIVQYIVEQTVGPALAERTAPFRTPDGKITDEAGLAQAILGLNCLDPAMGSGHFLVAAADYIARFAVEMGLAAEETRRTNAPPSAISHQLSAESELAYWRRRVAQACIYGVDLNPLAVELAKLSLWLATVSKDKPLSFLDHHLRCGNSLIGARVADLPLGLAPAEQIAKERKAAYKAQQAARKKEEAARAAGQITMLDDSAFAGAMHTASGMMRLIEDLGSETLADVHRAEEVYRDSVRAVTERARLLGDIWTARHFGLTLDETIWGGLSRYLLHGGFEMPAYRPVIEQARAVADERRFFHWELEFPEVFFDEYGRLVEGGGFDVVIANPPYRKADADIEWQALRYRIMAQNRFTTTHLKWDLYVPFIELAAQLTRTDGQFGMIVENSLEIAPYASRIRELLFAKNTLQQLHFFPGVQLFAEAGVYCTVFIAARATPSIPYAVHRYLHRDTEINADELPTRRFENPDDVFRLDQDLGRRETIIPLGRLCYINKGATLQAHDLKYRGEFIKDDLLSATQDATHPKPYIEGKLIRDLIPDRVLYLEYGPGTRNPARVMEPRFPEMFENPKLVFGKTSGVILDRDNLWCDQSGRVAVPFHYLLNCSQRSVNEQMETASVAESKLHDLGYLLTIARSKLAVRFLTSQSTDTRDITPDTLKRLPIRRIAFITPAEPRAALAAEARRLADAAIATGDFAPALVFVAEQLSPLLSSQERRGAGGEERSDVVHDLLAGLAEQMIELNKQRRAEMRGFLAWLERETGGRIEDLTGKSQLKGYLGDYQKDEPSLPFEGLLAILRKNRGKLKVDPAGRKFQETLKREYDASLAVLLPLKARLAATDRLIDQVVYRLYGLTEEEIAVVEGAT